MSAVIPDNTLVVVGRNLGRVVCSTRLGSVPGYNVEVVPETHLEGTAPHFAEAWYVKVAEIGVNVCRTRRGQCFCGLVHISNPEWLEGGTPEAAASSAAAKDERGHTPIDCTDRECIGCRFCAGVPYVCGVCNGAEDTMPSSCPEQAMTGVQIEEVRAGRLDYRAGLWVNARAPWVPTLPRDSVDPMRGGS